MSDEAIQVLRRQVEIGEPDARPRLIVELARRGNPAAELWLRPDRCVHCGMGQVFDSSGTGVAPQRCHDCAGTGFPLRARVELAAYCGSEAAREVLGACSCGCGWRHGTQTLSGAVSSARDHADDRDFLTFVKGIYRWAHIHGERGLVSVLAVTASARVVLRHIWQGHAQARHEALVAVIAAEQWCRLPCDVRLEEWTQAWVVATRAYRFGYTWVPAPMDREELELVNSLRAAVDCAPEAELRAAVKTTLTEWALRV